MSASPSRLKLAGISKSFPGIKALDDVTFEVRPGEVHGLLGENGAGKSTLLNTLSAVFRADAGHIEIDGRPVEIRRPQRLTEADRGWLQQAAASAAGRMPRRLEGLEVRGRIARGMAALAFHQQVRAVQLDEHTG